ncbi:MAG: hypothetical protein HKN40_02400 [Winogradskyella sp.]|uniref:hypothetical protein n=1 Tax=Winogradskyella sp. TaxID=1883156 RepID=UPI0017E36725|nr:hypothetical protein [Winogradskyella sp.]
MKKVILLFCLCTSICSFGQEKQTQKERFKSTYEAMKELVESQRYAYVGHYVYSNKNREKLKAGNNTIQISGSKAHGQLRHLSVYNEDSWRLNAKFSNYQVDYIDEEQIISIQFNIEDLNIYFDIKPNGNVFLTAKKNGKFITQLGKIKNI